MTETTDLTTQTTELAGSDPIPLAPDNHMVVLAKDPQQMQASQQQLIVWFDERTRQAQAELNDAEENLAQAKSRKWATAGWKRQVKLHKGRVNFYGKCQEALEAGYCIVPDFPTEIFAVRTSRKKPKANTRKRTGYSPAVATQTPDSSPVGQGEYVSPHAELAEEQTPIPTKDYQGNPKTETQYTVWAEKYSMPDFPLKTVKPQILDATGKAMALKIFDEMGVLPARRGGRSRLQGDPIVTGRIMRQEGTREIGLTFLISWWIDTRDL